MNSKQPFTYELTTFDGRSWPLTQANHDSIIKKMQANTRLLEMPDTSLISINNVKGMVKRQVTMADMLDEQKALPRGEVKFNPNGAGYKKFLEAWKKVNPKSYSEHMRALAERQNNDPNTT